MPRDISKPSTPENETMRTIDKNAYLATAIGRLLSENTGAAFISTAASIAILRERTGTAVTDAALQKLLTEMARVRGMTMLFDRHKK